MVSEGDEKMTDGTVNFRKSEIRRSIDSSLQKLASMYKEKKEVYSTINKFTQWELAKMYESELSAIKDVVRFLLMVKGLMVSDNEEIYVDIIKDLSEEARSISPELAIDLRNLLEWLNKVDGK